MGPFDSSSSLQALRDAFQGVLASAPVGTRWVAVSCAAPGGAALSLLDQKLSDYSAYFVSGSGSTTAESGSVERDEADLAFLGIGVTDVIRLEGANRFIEAEQRISGVYERLFAAPELMPRLRYFGGASFSPGRDGKGPCWEGFGDACFLLPRLLYVDAPGGAMLACIASVDEVEDVLKQADAVLQVIEQRSESVPVSLETTKKTDSEGRGKWQELVESIQESIGRGELKKVVAARRVTLELSSPPRLSDIVRRLNEQAPRCARFALRVGERTFVGATPERLIRRRGRSVHTEALAGSIDSHRPDAASELLQSSKDQQEHAFVVEAIRQCLTPLCSSLTLPNGPEVRGLRHLLHLRTPIRGELTSDLHVLSLVGQLHPTPAVGGLPREQALRFIADHEQAERGWYAAPVGWVDSSGDGEFVVALRSGLICNNKVHLYAGAGIVSESDPVAEYDETELKLSGMLVALGVAS